MTQNAKSCNISHKKYIHHLQKKMFSNFQLNVCYTRLTRVNILKNLSSLRNMMSFVYLYRTVYDFFTALEVAIQRHIEFPQTELTE